MNKNINDMVSFNQQRNDMRQQIEQSNNHLLHSAKQLIKFNFNKVNTDFSKPSWQSDLEAIGDIRQKFLPRMTAKILHATLLRKKGFFKRTILSAAASFTVKKLFKKGKKSIPSMVDKSPLHQPKKVIPITQSFQKEEKSETKAEMRQEKTLFQQNQN